MLYLAVSSNILGCSSHRLRRVVLIYQLDLNHDDF